MQASGDRQGAAWRATALVACLVLLAACGGGGEDPGPSYSSVAVADVNGDGLVDVVALGRDDGPTFAAIFEQTAPGRFAHAVSLLAAPYYGLAVVTGDFNGDGRADIATFNEDTPTGRDALPVLLHAPVDETRYLPAINCLPGWTGSTVVEPDPACAALSLPGRPADPELDRLTVQADLNRDGLPDRVIAYHGDFDVCEAFNCEIHGARLSVMLQDPAAPGTYLPAIDYGAIGDAYLWWVAVADMNDDGWPDLIACESHRLYVRLQDPARPGTFPTVIRVNG